MDIQAKRQEGKGKGYERWAKVFNLKEAAGTPNFLTENGVTDYEELAARKEVQMTNYFYEIIDILPDT